MCAIQIIGTSLIIFLYSYLQFFFLINIATCLFVGSIFRGFKKIIKITIVIIVFLNAFSLLITFNYLFQKNDQKEKSIFTYVFNIIPSYVLSSCPITHYYENFSKKILLFLEITEKEEMFFYINPVVSKISIKKSKNTYLDEKWTCMLIFCLSSF